MRPALRSIMWIGLVSVSAPVLSAPYSPEVLIERASEHRLWKAEYWQILLHRKPGLFGTRSIIDDPDFFLAPNGKYDARAELEETIKGLLARPDPGAEHVFDRFPARCEWLISRLELDRDRLPVPRCDEIEEIIEGIDPQGAVFIFPNAYMNTPASMFGHTLVAVRGRDPDMLSQAVSYAAFTQETNGPIFAIRGIFGLYDGYYSVMPYYQKIQEYNDMNMRDIWEYELDFTRPEVERMMRHIWELHEISSRYFFFDENCSYSILILLDAARPGQGIYRGTRPWVIPLDTLRLIHAAGFVKETRYRPSRATRIRAMGRELTAAQRGIARRIADGELTPDDAVNELEAPAAQARVLDLAAAFLQARRAKEEVDKETYSRRFLKCLSARSKVDLDPGESMLEIPAPASPDQGHDSVRLSVGYGRDSGESYTSLGLRPAYHSLDDPPAGYLDGAEVQFANLELRVPDDDGGPKFQRLDIVRVKSISPRDEFFKPTSWEAYAAVVRDWIADGRRRTYTDLGLALGRGWRIAPGSLAYILPACEIRLGDFDGGHSLGGGCRAGARLAVAGKLQVGSELRAVQFVSGNCYPEIEATLDLLVPLGRNLSLVGELTTRKIDHETHDGFSLALRAYF